MIEFVKQIIAGQFEAALCMLDDCVRTCPREHWDGVIGRYPFWQVAYHTLCFVDLYLSPSQEAFEFRPIHPCGWSEFEDENPSRRFERAEITEYLAICRKKMIGTLAAETAESLQRPAGFSWLKFSRAELHLYNLRHVQHHTGQLGAYLRKIDPSLQTPKVLRWVSTGWREL